MSRIYFLPQVLFFGLFVFAVYATNVQQCKSKNFDLENNVNISSCNNPPCRLRRKSEAKVEINFSPDQDIKHLRTNVHAVIAGIPFPFIGVDGTTACGKVFKEDKVTKVSCPLKKGEKYVYINSFKVLDQYPKIKVLVHWTLTDTNNGKAVTCFEVPARITN